MLPCRPPADEPNASRPPPLPDPDVSRTSPHLPIPRRQVRGWPRNPPSVGMQPPPPFHPGKLLLASLLLTLSLTASAEVGVGELELRVGQSAVLEGPSAALGQGMRTGLEAAFREVNAAGGIHGRQLRLITRDDGYEPIRAITNARALLHTDKVFALLGIVGTPTAKGILPLCEESRVPLLGSFTGAAILRSDTLRSTINLRASYDQETERLTQHLAGTRGFRRIACFYQNDAYGQSGLAGITAALKRRGLDLAATGNYERNTTAVKTGLLDVRKGQPDAVVLVGTYKACAEFIRLARRIGMSNTVFANISFVGTRALQKELGHDAEGVIVSQVVPHPLSSNLPIVREYQASLQRQSPGASPDWISLEGYLLGRFFAEMLRQTGPSPDRASLLQTISGTSTLDLGGWRLNFGPQDRQGSDDVYLTVFSGGEVRELEPAAAPDS